MSRFDQDFGEPASGQPLKARLKWFNPSKGFGFVSPVDGTDDAFLHVSVLHRAGLQQLGDQAELMCEIAHGPKGPQVLNILEILHPGSVTSNPPQVNEFVRARPMRPAGPEHEVAGTVKWYKMDKGFGFVTITDTDQDVFVHKTVLQRSGLDMLEPGQHVDIRYQDVEKGREATWIAVRAP